ncbi:hypothetical protein ACWGET_21780 [Streptomyces zaomyceticus]
MAPPVTAGATAEPITHRNWTDEWVTVRCGACGREDDWPHPELGCSCGTVLRVPVRAVDASDGTDAVARTAGEAAGPSYRTGPLGTTAETGQPGRDTAPGVPGRPGDPPFRVPGARGPAGGSGGSGGTAGSWPEAGAAPTGTGGGTGAGAGPGALGGPGVSGSGTDERGASGTGGGGHGTEGSLPGRTGADSGGTAAGGRGTGGSADAVSRGFAGGTGGGLDGAGSAGVAGGAGAEDGSAAGRTPFSPSDPAADPFSPSGPAATDGPRTPGADGSAGTAHHGAVEPGSAWFGTGPSGGRGSAASTGPAAAGPGGADPGTGTPGAGPGSAGRGSGVPGAGSAPGSAAHRRPTTPPVTGGPRTFAERYPSHIPLPPTAPRPAPVRGTFRPLTIRTARDAVAAAAGYLRWLGFRDVVQPEERPASGVDLRAPGLVAQVDPSTRPTGLRAVECLWLNGLSTSAVSVFFSLAGYTPEARSRAAEIGLPLFVLDLTGTPQPVNTAADDLSSGGA